MPVATIIIPARLGSTRFPRKVLADRTGTPMIGHVMASAGRAACAARVVVATDSAEVARAVESLGGTAVLTSAAHPNGTSRLAEAASVLGLGADEIVVNVQGDEPEIEPEAIDAVASRLAGSGAPTATLASPGDSGADDPNVVKVVVNRAGEAMYFSRSAIPHGGEAGSWLRHVGVYAYRRSFLDVYVGLEPTPLERAERLEQLRVLEHGYRMAVGVLDRATPAGIDTPEQYAAFVERWKRARGG